MLVLILVVLDARLLLQNSRLRSVAEQALSGTTPKIGTVVPALVGLGLDGNRAEISFPSSQGQASLVFVFSPACSICDVTWPYWEALQEQLSGMPYRVVYANTGPRVSPDYIGRFPALRDGIVVDVDPQSMLAYNLQLTPLVLLISAEGRIEGVWVGMLDGTEQAELEHAILGPLRTPSESRGGSE